MGWGLNGEGLDTVMASILEKGEVFLVCIL